MEDNQIQQNKNVSGIQINRLRKTFSSAGVIACDDVDQLVELGGVERASDDDRGGYAIGHMDLLRLCAPRRA